MPSNITLRTGAWFGDKHIELQMPSEWKVDVLWPETPTLLKSEQLERILDRPVGQVSIKELCKGKSKPIIIVDDLNRPTPVSQVMPLLLKRIWNSGIPEKNVTIIMACGTHGHPDQKAWVKKIGGDAVSASRLIMHDCFRDGIKIGATTFGTPVFVNKAVLEGDLVIGVGGIYPNHTAGFGGGSKLALGVLGIRTIYHLHFRHKMSGWGTNGVDNGFRRELDEIAGMIGMNMSISMIIDADRNIIQMYCGDQKEYFNDAVKYYRNIFSTHEPKEADVIISNAYPNDLSLTFARMKGFLPLNNCNSWASRVGIASCSEGLGLHNIFPFINRPRFCKSRHVFSRLSIMSPGEIINKGVEVLNRKMKSSSNKIFGPRKASGKEIDKIVNPIWLYRPGDHSVKLPSFVPGINIRSEWSEILEAIRNEQGNRDNLRVLIYPCAFLQIF